MSKNMVERVASRLEELAGRGPYGYGGPEDWSDYARAAIEAMAPATDEMIAMAADTPGMKAAGAAMQMHQARGYGFAAGSFDDGSPIAQVWQAMITAALKP